MNAEMWVKLKLGEIQHEFKHLRMHIFHSVMRIHTYETRWKRVLLDQSVLFLCSKPPDVTQSS